MGCDIISQAEDTVYHGHAASGTLQHMSVFYKLAVILSFGEKKYCESANKIIKKDMTYLSQILKFNLTYCNNWYFVLLLKVIIF